MKNCLNIKSILSQKLKNISIFEILFYFFALSPFLSAIIYYIYALNTVGLIILILSLFTSIFLLISKNDNNYSFKNIFKFSKKSVILLILFVFFIISSFITLSLDIPNNSIVSPFNEIKPFFFVFYSLILLSLIFINKDDKTNILWKLLSNIIFYFLSFSLLVIIFKIYYGFDPFIHQASLDYILNNGQILPKTPYYNGYYGLIVLLHKISGLSIFFLNKFLNIILSAVLLPIVFYDFLKHYVKKINLNSILLPLIIGFSPFVFTTPQNLSYLFLILTIFYSLTDKGYKKSLFLSLSTAAIHPLSGIPAISFFILNIIKNNKVFLKHSVKKTGIILVFIFNSLAIPLSLYLTTGKNASIYQLYTNINFYFKNIFTLNLETKGNIFLNTAYFFANNYILILAIFLIFSLFYLSSLKNEKFKKLINISLISISSLLISLILSSSLIFKDVINYEQRDYAIRISKIILIHFLPLFLIFFNLLLDKIQKNKLSVKVSGIILLLALVNISLYLSYPRVDKYFNSRGFSTSYFDIQTVLKINNDAEGEKYFVLANQQVSAAALKEFGFENNLDTENNESVYFYPIPTGSRMYQFYLSMVYDNPNKENMKKALEYANTNVSYLVINNYWYRSQELINTAKIEADSYFDINNEVFIFKYLR